MSTVVGLRQNRDSTPPGPAGGVRPDSQTATVDREPGDAICCRFCLQVITSAGERVAQSGAHRHTFANPHGYLFEIGCFRSAPGCRSEGPAVTEFSWFSGYAWRIAACGRCLNHLGWRFQGAAPSFYGLILNNLIQIDSDTSHE